MQARLCAGTAIRCLSAEGCPGGVSCDFTDTRVPDDHGDVCQCGLAAGIDGEVDFSDADRLRDGLAGKVVLTTDELERLQVAETGSPPGILDAVIHIRATSGAPETLIDQICPPAQP